MGCGASATPKVLAAEKANVEEAQNVQNTDAIIEKPVQGATDSQVVQGSPVQEANVVPKANVAQEPPAVESLGTFVARCSEEDSAKLAELSRKAEMVQGLTEAALASVSSNPGAAAGLVAVAAAVAQDMPAVTAAAVKTDIAAAAVGLAETAMAAASSGSATTEGLVMAAAATAMEAAQLRSRH